MWNQDRDDPGREQDLLSGRVVRIGLEPARLRPDQRDILNDIRRSCPACDNPERCASDLAVTSPVRDWEDWDEYCPNAARLRILAALTMFPVDAS